ncbi:MAG: hypothetical protein KTM48_03650 [Wolbachia endosymbiont of Pissodes strobi]|nr:hypothetical protein [Wolbachia endosymbiont of Pissodes strobi]
MIHITLKINSLSLSLSLSLTHNFHFSLRFASTYLNFVSSRVRTCYLIYFSKFFFLDFGIAMG